MTGSAAPDAYYAMNGLVVVPPTHNILGLLWFGLPVSLACTWVIRRTAPVIAAHLPSFPRWMALRDYGVLGQVKYPFYATIYSSLIGGGTHIIWDGFTHHPHVPHGWGTRLFPVLDNLSPIGASWWLLAQHGSTVIGAVVALVTVVHIGRRRLLIEWHGSPPATVRMPKVFWSTLGVVAATYLLIWPLLPYRWAPYVQGVRFILIAAVSFLMAALVTSLAARAKG